MPQWAADDETAEEVSNNDEHHESEDGEQTNAPDWDSAKGMLLNIYRFAEARKRNLNNTININNITNETHFTLAATSGDRSSIAPLIN